MTKRGYDAMNLGGGDDFSGMMQQPNKKARTEDSARNVMVNYMPKSFTEDKMRQLFSQFGEIESCNLMTEAGTGQSKCFGFVKFVTVEGANAAIEGLHGFKVEGKTLRVAHGQKQKKDVFFSGFGVGFSDNDLRVLASTYGTVEDATVLDPAKHPKGVGFVRFATPEEATRCISTLDGFEFGQGSTLSTLVVKYPRSKEDEKQEKQQQMRNRQMGGRGGMPAMNNNMMANMGNMMGNMGNLAPEQMQFLQMFNLMQQGGMGGMGGMGNMMGMMGNNMNPMMGGGGMGGGRTGGGGPPTSSGGVATEHILFVLGFTEATEAEARPLFDQFGACKYDIPHGANRRPRNYCFIHFPSAQQASNAVQKVNDHQLPNGKKLQVSFKK